MYLLAGRLTCNLNHSRADNSVMLTLLSSIYASFRSGSTKELNLNNFVTLFERENEKYSHEKLEDSDQIVVGGTSLSV